MLKNMFVGKHGQRTAVCGTNVLSQKHEGKRYFQIFYDKKKQDIVKHFFYYLFYAKTLNIGYQRKNY